MRLQRRPVFRASVSVPFTDFAAGAEAARAIAQAGLYPANCRLLDPGEAELAGAGGEASVLLIAFESADHPLDAWITRAAECAADHGGTLPAELPRTRRTDEGARDGTAGAWRGAFLNGPYLRDAIATLGLLSETFETAVTWDRFAEFHAGVLGATRDALARVCGGGRVSCRFTHVYPDGPAPYYTVIAPARPGGQLAQWAEVKTAASEAILRFGGTITHHHAVGRDHRPWYDRQRPAPFAAALTAAKRALDPAGILNPGVLLDP
jgi:alkyldihydroxyacetonephosphate synthase